MMNWRENNQTYFVPQMKTINLLSKLVLKRESKTRKYQALIISLWTKPTTHLRAK